MPVIVCFATPGGLGTINAVGVGRVRAAESLALNGTTTASVQDGEIVLLCSTEASTVLGAHGTTPDAAATAATAATSAGFPIPAGVLVPVAAAVGSKINVKATA